MNAIPEGFAEVGVRLDLLLTGWIGLGALVIAIACVAVAFFWGGEEFFGFVAVIFGLTGLIVGGFWLAMLVPFDGKYHHHYRVEGTVTEVSNVVTEASGDLTRQPVVKLDSVSRPLVVDDPRAVDLEGRDVVLRCEIGWHYQAADTYSCSIVDFGDAA